MKKWSSEPAARVRPSRGTELWVDETQFPDAIHRDLIRSLKTGRFNHKFHYDSVKQAVAWTELHRRYSPFRNDAACRNAYRRAFRQVAARIPAGSVHVVGLGCGSGEKDILLAQTLSRRGLTVRYTPTDVGAAMALIAWRNATKALGRRVLPPLVFDLTTTRNLDDLPGLSSFPSTRRLITFFGLIPNLEPVRVFPGLAKCLRSGGMLLAGVNLLPAMDHALRRVLTQYDNPLTKDWLGLALKDLGIDDSKGRIGIRAREMGLGRVRIEARFRFVRDCCVRLPGCKVRFNRHDSLRLFFSDRYTPQSFESTVSRFGLRVKDRWLAPSGEEGIFLLTV